jgi:hypothetical protein
MFKRSIVEDVVRVKQSIEVTMRKKVFSRDKQVATRRLHASDVYVVQILS